VPRTSLKASSGKIVQRIFLCVDVAAQPHAVINPFFAKDI